jgi:hypothetical protein
VGTGQVAGPPSVIPHTLDDVLADGGVLEVLHLVVIEPDALAIRTPVHLNIFELAYGQCGAATWTVHITLTLALSHREKGGWITP